MIIPPPDWSCDAGWHRVVLEPPVGRGRGRIVVCERLPLMSFVEVIARFAPEAPGFSGGGWPAIQRFVTDEGELAAWTEMEGYDRGRRCRRFVGAVCLDERVAGIHAIGADAAGDALVGVTARELLRTATFGLALRQRRFVYSPPSGWGGVAVGSTATWVPPDYPNHASRIVVMPAEPSTMDPTAELARALADAEVEGVGSVVAMNHTTAGGLRGVRATVEGRRPGDSRPQRLEIVLLSDGHRLYPLWLEAALGHRLEADIALLLALADGVEPLPPPPATLVSSPRR